MRGKRRSITHSLVGPRRRGGGRFPLLLGGIGVFEEEKKLLVVVVRAETVV